MKVLQGIRLQMMLSEDRGSCLHLEKVDRMASINLCLLAFLLSLDKYVIQYGTSQIAVCLRIP